MLFDFPWLLLGLPFAFALGWLASRLDLRQSRLESQKAPKAYFQGLNLLLNEQHDKAIDAFIEAVQHDPDTSDLHFALGNLFRRRGEYERATRVHEHLLHRADLSKVERERAQHALAQDFVQAGLFDRAEQAYQMLQGSSFNTEAQLALLTLHERSRNWHAALGVAQKLEGTGHASFTHRMAHYWCEIALECSGSGQALEADHALSRARAMAPLAARAWIISGERAKNQADHAQALVLWGELFSIQPAALNLVAQNYAQSALACGQQTQAWAQLDQAYNHTPTVDLMRALCLLQGSMASATRTVALAHLNKQRSLSAAHMLLTQAGPTLTEGEMAQLLQTLEHVAAPLQRYRCAACGFEAQHYFWQCPGCSNWDSYPPQRLEDL
jgi:lipopolysaccharide assembly protein B